MPYLKGEIPSHLESYVPQVNAYANAYHLSSSHASLLSLHALPHSLTLSPHDLQVITAFINSRMELVAHLLHAKEDAIDDPLADDESLNEQLDTLPSLCRFQLQQVSPKVLSLNPASSKPCPSSLNPCISPDLPSLL